MRFFRSRSSSPNRSPRRRRGGKAKAGDIQVVESRDSIPAIDRILTAKDYHSDDSHVSDTKSRYDVENGELMESWSDDKYSQINHHLSVMESRSEEDGNTPQWRPYDPFEQEYQDEDRDWYLESDEEEEGEKVRNAATSMADTRDEDHESRISHPYDEAAPSRTTAEDSPPTESEAFLDEQSNTTLSTSENFAVIPTRGRQPNKRRDRPTRRDQPPQTVTVLSPRNAPDDMGMNRDAGRFMMNAPTKFDQRENMGPGVSLLDNGGDSPEIFKPQVAKTTPKRVPARNEPRPGGGGKNGISRNPKKQLKQQQKLGKPTVKQEDRSPKAQAPRRSSVPARARQSSPEQVQRPTPDRGRSRRLVLDRWRRPTPGRAQQQTSDKVGQPTTGQGRRPTPDRARKPITGQVRVPSPDRGVQKPTAGQGRRPTPNRVQASAPPSTRGPSHRRSGGQEGSNNKEKPQAGGTPLRLRLAIRGSKTPKPAESSDAVKNQDRKSTPQRLRSLVNRASETLGASITPNGTGANDGVAADQRRNGTPLRNTGGGTAKAQAGKDETKKGTLQGQRTTAGGTKAVFGAQASKVAVSAAKEKLKRGGVVAPRRVTSPREPSQTPKQVQGTERVLLPPHQTTNTQLKKEPNTQQMGVGGVQGSGGESMPTHSGGAEAKPQATPKPSEEKPAKLSMAARSLAIFASTLGGPRREETPGTIEKIPNDDANDHDMANATTPKRGSVQKEPKKKREVNSPVPSPVLSPKPDPEGEVVIAANQQGQVPKREVDTFPKEEGPSPKGETEQVTKETDRGKRAPEERAGMKKDRGRGLMKAIGKRFASRERKRSREREKTTSTIPATQGKDVPKPVEDAKHSTLLPARNKQGPLYDDTGALYPDDDDDVREVVPSYLPGDWEMDALENPWCKDKYLGSVERCIVHGMRGFDRVVCTQNFNFLDTLVTAPEPKSEPPSVAGNSELVAGSVKLDKANDRETVSNRNGGSHHHPVKIDRKTRSAVPITAIEFLSQKSMVDDTTTVTSADHTSSANGDKQGGSKGSRKSLLGRLNCAAPREPKMD